jgi:hypothetical protein
MILNGGRKLGMSPIFWNTVRRYRSTALIALGVSWGSVTSLKIYHVLLARTKYLLSPKQQKPTLTASSRCVLVKEWSNIEV